MLLKPHVSRRREVGLRAGQRLDLGEVHRLRHQARLLEQIVAKAAAKDTWVRMLIDSHAAAAERAAAAPAPAAPAAGG